MCVFAITYNINSPVYRPTPLAMYYVALYTQYVDIEKS